MNRAPRFRLPARAATLVALVALLVLAAPAFAATDPTEAQYQDSVTQAVEGGGGDGSPQATATAAGGGGTEKPALQKDLIGGLPFTGLDVVALAAVALALTAVGLGLRQFTEPRR